jgi:predicted nucleic-acid-binding protein
VIGLDTNVVVRYLVRDDPGQTALADGVLDDLEAQDPGFVSVVVAVETWWVLRRSYHFSQVECLTVMNGLIASRELVFEHADVVRRSLVSAARGSDFADAVIVALGQRAGCTETVTFDAGAARAVGMRLLG